MVIYMLEIYMTKYHKQDTKKTDTLGQKYLKTFRGWSYSSAVKVVVSQAQNPGFYLQSCINQEWEQIPVIPAIQRQVDRNVRA